MKQRLRVQKKYREFKTFHALIYDNKIMIAFEKANRFKKLVDKRRKKKLARRLRSLPKTPPMKFTF